VSEPAAGDITVRRCLVRVVRHGGWSWGPDPQDLVRQVLAALPDLLAAQYDGLLTGEGPDIEITEPVRLSVLLGRSRSGAAGLPASVVIEPTLGALPLPEPAPEEVRPLPASESTVDSPVVAGRVEAVDLAGTPAELFAELAVRDELAALLALLPDETLRVFAAAVLADPAADPADSSSVPGRLRAELARRLPAIAALPTTREELRRLALSSSEGETAGPPAETAPEPAVPVPSPVDVPVTAGETRVCSALPFLLVGPLARTGYLDAIGPALAAVDLLAEAPLFAAALAYTVLGAPERGWRHTPDDNATAAAFAGLAEAPELGTFPDRVRQALPVLDGVLALSLCRGHDPADPLLVTGLDGGLLLVDAQGLFPIAWSPDVAGLLPHWTACGRPPVLVCDSPLPPTCLRDLANAGVDLLTEVRPLRDDPLTRLSWRTPLWTHGTPPRRLATDLPAYTERAAELVRTLFTARLARSAGGPLERSAGLAASLSLGMIAWTLWHERETPDPVLAMTRFADLEATVRYERDAVRVRLPLGRRHTDLWRNGLLTDVPNVVWLDGRSLTFSGG
jgi:hypothetical protein